MIGKFPQGTQGFTLIELLLVLALTGVLAALATPSFVHLVETEHARFLCKRLVQAIEDTRLQATIMHRKLVLCGFDARGGCALGWEQGWLQKSSSGKKLALWRLGKERGKLHYRFFPRGRSALVFLGNGWPEIENGTFWYCPEHRPLPAFALRLDRFGSVRIEQPVTEQVAHEDRLECV